MCAFQIENIRARGKLPILVGGTHYYIQSLIFNESLLSLDDASELVDDDSTRKQEADNEKHWPILAAPTSEILAKLMEVDPVMAQRWHPNDRRKIRRNLEIYLQTGRRASDIYAEQEARRARITDTAHQGHDDAAKVAESNDLPDDSSAYSAEPTSLRFPTLLLWPHVPRPILSSRLDVRVDKMLTFGLLKEAQTLHDFSSSLSTCLGQAVDETRGIYTAVGYKEFKPYLNALSSSFTTSGLVSIQARTIDNNLETLKQEGIDSTKSATRRYAKSQLRWIRIKLVNALADADAKADAVAATQRPSQPSRASLYILDASDPSPPSWSANVLDPAIRYTSAFLSSLAADLDSPSAQPQPSSLAIPDPLTEAALLGPEFLDALKPLHTKDVCKQIDEWQVKTCEICAVSAVREEEWERHLNSGRHKRAEKGVMKRRERDRVLRERQALGVADETGEGG